MSASLSGMTADPRELLTRPARVDGNDQRTLDYSWVCNELTFGSRVNDSASKHESTVSTDQITRSKLFSDVLIVMFPYQPSVSPLGLSQEEAKGSTDRLRVLTVRTEELDAEIWPEVVCYLVGCLSSSSCKGSGERERSGHL